MARPYRLGVVGLGKIGVTQHLPAIAGSDAFELVAVADPANVASEVPRFASLQAMLEQGPRLDAVSICTPPSGRRHLAALAIGAGLAVMLEKPPGTTVAEVALLARSAQAAGVTLFTAWHSREAPGVAAAAAWLEGREPRRIRIDWREDIRRWHPGQEWILDANGFGVFDPAINAFSILTAIVRGTPRPQRAVLDIPANRHAPVAARIELTLDAVHVDVELDFLQDGRQVWDIVVESDGGTLTLRDGGSRLFIDEREEVVGPDREYAGLYRHFARLIEDGGSDVDVSPLRIVEDILACAERRPAPPFHF